MRPWRFSSEAQALAERHTMIPELARLHHLRGNIFFPLGNIEGCRQEHERGLAYARRSGSAEAEARALGGLADAAYAQGRMRTAFEHFSQLRVAESRARVRPNRGGESIDGRLQPLLPQ